MFVHIHTQPRPCLFLLIISNKDKFTARGIPQYTKAVFFKSRKPSLPRRPKCIIISTKTRICNPVGLLKSRTSSIRLIPSSSRLSAKLSTGNSSNSPGRDRDTSHSEKRQLLFNCHSCKKRKIPATYSVTSIFFLISHSNLNLFSSHNIFQTKWIFLLFAKFSIVYG